MKKIVIKVGSSTLSGGSPTLSKSAMENLSIQMSSLHKSGYFITLVSSGAIVAGKEVIARRGKTIDTTCIPSKQMLAAAGQVFLMHKWSQLFEMHDISVAQILLTKQDFLLTESRINARNTFDALLNHRILPIVNENDTVATEEIKVGDNDTLSAQVAVMQQADLLILLTDQDGLYTADPRIEKNAKHLPYIEKIDKEIRALASASSNPLGLGTGGMTTKIEAAAFATENGIPTIITTLKSSASLSEAVAGKSSGTFFKAEAK